MQAKKKQLCYSRKLPLNSSFRSTSRRRTQSPWTNYYNIKQRNEQQVSLFARHARNFEHIMFLRSARGMTTNADTHAYSHVRAIARTHREEGHVLTDAKVPLLSVLFDARSPRPSVSPVSFFLFRTRWNPGARPFLTRGTRTPLGALSLRSTDERSASRQHFSGRRRHAPRARSTSIHLSDRSARH